MVNSNKFHITYHLDTVKLYDTRPRGRVDHKTNVSILKIVYEIFMNRAIFIYSFHVFTVKRALVLTFMLKSEVPCKARRTHCDFSRPI